MRVAIIGSGLAGLSCAHELQRNNIGADIFQMHDFIGEILEFSGVMLYLFSTPIKSPYKYLRNNYKIDIKPHYELKEITMVAPSREYTLKGNFGYITRRGPGKDSLLNQIYPTIISPVKFNTFGDVDVLKHEYDHVLLSTGNSIITSKLSTYHETFNSYVRIATVKGKFRTDKVVLWFNTDYAKHGYVYLIPYTEDLAKLIHIVTETTPMEFEKYWNRFLSECKMNFNITNTVDTIHRLGLLETNRDGNVFYAGYAGGMTDSILGFGAISSIVSGVRAAQCMINSLDYDKCIGDLKKDVEKKHQFRIAYNSLDNDGIDRLISILCAPVIRQAVYNNPLLHAVQGALGVKLYNVLKGNRTTL